MKFLTPEEATAAFLTMDEKFQSAMKQNLINEAKFASLFNEFTLVKEAVSGSNSLNAEMGNKLKDMSNLIEQKISNFGVRIEQIVAKVEGQAKSHAELASDVSTGLSRANSNLSDASQRISAISSNVVTKDDLVGHVASFSKRIEALESAIQQLQIGLDSHGAFIESAHGKIAKTNISVDDVKNNVIALNGILSSMKGSIDSVRKDASVNLAAESAKIVGHIGEKIDAAKTELAAHSSPIDAMRDDLLKKIEDMSIDGRNAVLKAGNSSQQIAIIEKKIENILLTLKKIDLSKE